MSNKPVDDFAAIALTSPPEERPALEPVPPRQYPPRPHWDGTEIERQPPPPYARLATPEDLDRRVADLRARYEPFLQNRVPAIPKSRPRQDLEQFEFRLEEPADLKDAQRPYGEKGNWESVRVPHYRGPEGRWAAYYRTRFGADAALFDGDRVWLKLRGVDYKCQVYVNGMFVGEHEGFFEEFEFDVTGPLRSDGENVLLIRVENDAKQNGSSVDGEKLLGSKIYAATGLGWDEPGSGWHHCPPGAGVWQPVFLEARSTMAISELFARPEPEQERVELWVELVNSTFSNESLELEVSVYPRNFEGEAIESIRLHPPKAGPDRTLYKQRLHLRDFEWWTPDNPCLYTARVSLLDQNGQLLDVQDVSFGMRSFHCDETSEPKGTLFLNGQQIYLRGYNTMGHEQRAVFDGDFELLIRDILISKAGNVNYWRLTQRPVQREVYEYCDMLGMLTQTDLPLFSCVRVGQEAEVVRQAGAMERLIRRHPCNIMISYVNEPFADSWPQSTRIAHQILARKDLEDLLEACTSLVHIANPDRVVKPIDGDYASPNRHGMPDYHCYNGWYYDHGIPIGEMHAGKFFSMKPGWRAGCGEYGAEGLDPWETMAAHYPKDWRPANPDERWDPDKIARNQTWDIHRIWFDRQDTARSWIEASQCHQAWSVRVTTDAYRRRADRFVSTVLHLGIDAYPAGWMKTVVSVDRIPKPAFFEYADSLTPLAVNLRTDRQAVFSGEPLGVECWILNDTPAAPKDHTLVLWVREGDKVLFCKQVPARIRASDAELSGVIDYRPDAASAPRKLHVGVSLLDGAGEVRHDHQVDVEVYPPRDTALLAGRRVGIVGRSEGAAWRFAEAFGAQAVPYRNGEHFDLILTDDPNAVQALRAELGTWVEGGGCLILLEQQDPVTWQVGSRQLVVSKAGPFNFASRNTGHPIVNDLEWHHTKLWFNAEEGHSGHVVRNAIELRARDVNTGEEAEEVTTIVQAPTGGWGGGFADKGGLVELKLGSGRLVCNQLLLCRAVEVEPRAALLAERLLRRVL